MASPNANNPPKLISFSASTSSNHNTHQLVVKTRNLYIAVIISSFCAFCFGTTVGWTNPAENLVLKRNAHKFKPTKTQWDWICLMLPLGVIIWCLPMGALMKYHGCKPLMFLQVVPYTVGWILFIYADNIYMLYVGRFLQGMCGAAVSVAVPVYLDEISQWQYRGFIGSFYFGAFLYGIIYSNIMIEYIRLQTVYAINIGLALLCLLLKIIPESPMRYVCNNKLDKARDTLIWLRVKDHDVDKELMALSRVIENEMEPSVGCWTELKRTGSLRAVLKSSVLMCLHQSGGGVVIIYYLDNILSDVAKGQCMSCRLWVCFFMCLGHLICVLLVERTGRRPLLLVSTVIMSISSLYLCCWFRWSASSGWHASTRMIVYVFVGAYAMGLGPIACLLNVELIVAPARPYGCATANLFSWLTVFLMVTWLTFRLHHHVVFYLMLVICLVVLLFDIVFLPETKGLSPLQIKRRLAPTFVEYSSDESS
ncbi:glucose transporter type 3 [Drosophila innubila]|uniref:glucose transporter type 3 n=1 Tax=Drosophila innubila TaxID=198719 RepID=UPI00148D39D4|nr:glucose transporter type 3 [Drosophila innubila]